MSEYIITHEQVEELNKAHGGMKIVTSWLSCYAIWDTTNTYPVMKSEHIAVTLPEIVRCRDCRKCNVGWCLHFDNVVKPDGFCAWGVRRDA